MGDIVVINDELCMGCGACAEICPRQILYVDREESIAKVTDQNRCDRRRGCERVCPAEAIKIN